MAFQEKIDQLVTRLTELTERGKVSWEETAEEGARAKDNCAAARSTWRFRRATA